jgi:hypothetical protein
MRSLLASSALAIAFAVPAYAQVAPAKPATVESTTQGTLIVQGIEPSRVLSSIDTQKLVGEPAQVTTIAQVQPPEAKTQVTVDTTTVQTPSAKVETTTEVITPVSGRPALDPEYPIAPEVRAVVSSGKRYSTKDIVLAQLEAMRNTPVTQPTTTITTTTTTPAPG